MTAGDSKMTLSPLPDGKGQTSIWLVSQHLLGKAECGQQRSRGTLVGAAPLCCPPHPRSSQFPTPLKKIWSEKSENRASPPSFPPIENTVYCITIYSRWYMGLMGAWRQLRSGPAPVPKWGQSQPPPTSHSSQLRCLVLRASSQACAREAERAAEHTGQKGHGCSPGRCTATLGCCQRLWHPAMGGQGQHHRPCCHPTLWAHSCRLLRAAGTSHGPCG